MAKTLSKQLQYTVNKGDSLTKVCNSNGINDWKRVWDDPDNAALKKTRKKPDAIQPGDVVVLNPPTPSPKEIAKSVDFFNSAIEGEEEKKIKNLDKLEADMHKQENDIIKEVEDSAKEVTKVTDRVDAVAKVISVLKSLIAFFKAAAKGIGKTGEELEKANDEMRDVIKDEAKDQVYEKASENIPEIEESDSIVENAIVIARRWCENYDTPSFWFYNFMYGLEEWKSTGRVPTEWLKGNSNPNEQVKQGTKKVHADFSRIYKIIEDAKRKAAQRLKQLKKDRDALLKNPSKVVPSDFPCV